MGYTIKYLLCQQSTTPQFLRQRTNRILQGKEPGENFLWKDLYKQSTTDLFLTTYEPIGQDRIGASITGSQI